MKKKSRTLLLILALSLVIPAAAQEKKAADVSLSLQECIARALKQNIGLGVDILNPELSRLSVKAANEIFMPTVTVTGSDSHQDAASYSWIESTAGASVVTKTQQVDFTLSQYLPYGGTFTMDMYGYKTNTNQSAQTINPRYGSRLTFTLNQPLLKGFGDTISKYTILIAKDNLKVSEESLRQSVINLVYNVESAYWTLVYTIDNLDVKKTALKAAQDLLETNKRSVEVGSLAPIDILSAESEVATREADIIDAEAAVKNAEDAMKKLLNMSAEEEKSILAIIPKDAPVFEQKQVDLQDAVALAIENRPDLSTDRINIKIDDLNVYYEKNQMLPSLNLAASYWAPGVSGTEIIYNGDPLNGNINYTIPGNISGALKDTMGFKYTNWSVGLTLTVPTANIFSQAALKTARVTLKQAMLSLENDKQSAFVEIKTAVRAVETNYKRTVAYRVARELAEQKLAAEVAKLKVGQSTNYTVLTYQRDLESARISEINAVVTYQLALASLEKSMGTTLKDKNIRFVDYSRNN